MGSDNLNHAGFPEYRPPACSGVAEKTVLSQICLIGCQDTAASCARLREAEAAGVTENSFYYPAHKLILRTIAEMADEGKDISNAIAIAIRLEHAGELQSVGGHAGLMDILIFASTTSSFASHVQELRAIEKRRNVQMRLDALSKRSREKDCDPAKISAELQELAWQARVSPRRTRWPAREAVLEANRIFAAQYKARTHITGTRSGYYRLDDLTGGFKGGTLTVIGARPAMGKTTFGLNLACNITMHPPTGEAPTPVLFLSGEMPAPDLWCRIIAMESRVDIPRTVATQDMDGNVAFCTTSRHCENAPLLIEDISGRKIDAVLGAIRREHALGGARAVFVDYLQLIRGNTLAAEKNTVDSVAEVSQKLHMIACELDTPVIALAQVNRDTDGKNPQLVNLKGSGDIEQSADIVLLLDRPEVYADDSMPADYRNAIRNLAIVQVSKNRSGPTGKVCFDFVPECFLFSQRPDQTIPQRPSPRPKSK